MDLRQPTRARILGPGFDRKYEFDLEFSKSPSGKIQVNKISYYNLIENLRILTDEHSPRDLDKWINTKILAVVGKKPFTVLYKNIVNGNLIIIIHFIQKSEIPTYYL